MKLFANATKCITACGLALAIGSLVAAQAQTTKENKAVVKAVKGAAQAQASPGAQWVPLKAKEVLRPGTSVRTDAISTVDLDLGINGNALRVMPGSEITITTLSSSSTAEGLQTQTEIAVKAGSIIGNVTKKLSRNSKYEIKTPVSVCGIRGTKFKVSVDGKVWVLEGCVEIFYLVPGTNEWKSVRVCATNVFIPPGVGQATPTIVPIAPEDVVWSETKTFEDETGWPAGEAVIVTPPPEPSGEFVSPIRPGTGAPASAPPPPPPPAN
jgi:hypothetical protein